MKLKVGIKHPFPVDVIVPVEGGTLCVPMSLTVEELIFCDPLQWGDRYSVEARVSAKAWDKPTVEVAP